jgi:putative acetyltransferase
MIIRDETRRDPAAVRQVTVAAFDRTLEADLVEALRGSGDAAISLVAEDDGEIVGHVMFSKLQAPDRCLALAPVSVRPDRHRQGIASSLIRAGLASAKRDHWQAVFLLGEPQFYERFGFATATARKFETDYPKAYFMALELVPRALDERRGAVVYAPPFLALE